MCAIRAAGTAGATLSSRLEKADELPMMRFTIVEAEQAISFVAPPTALRHPGRLLRAQPVRN